MSKRPKGNDFTEEEAQRRFEQALRGAAKAGKAKAPAKRGAERKKPKRPARRSDD